jgi:hypothetical protein
LILSSFSSDCHIAPDSLSIQGCISPFMGTAVHGLHATVLKHQRYSLKTCPQQVLVRDSPKDNLPPSVRTDSEIPALL